MIFYEINNRRPPLLLGYLGQTAHKAIRITQSEIQDEIDEPGIDWWNILGPIAIVPQTILNTRDGLIKSIARAFRVDRSVIQNKTLPELVNDLQTDSGVEKVKGWLKDGWDTIWGPVTGVSTTIKYLPYFLIGGLAIATIFIFKNPGSVSRRR